MIIDTDTEVETDEFSEYGKLEVSVGKHAMEFERVEYVKYVDEIVEVFENQETINDIEMVPVEEPVVP